mgnify:CR=1 FL=1
MSRKLMPPDAPKTWTCARCRDSFAEERAHLKQQLAEAQRVNARSLELITRYYREIQHLTRLLTEQRKRSA